MTAIQDQIERRQVSNPFDKTVLLSCTIRMPGVSRKVGADRVQCDADLELIRVSKKIIDCEEYTAVQQASGAIKKFLRAKSVPGVRFIKGGIYPIPLHQVEEIDARVRELIEAFDAASARFVEVYEARAEESKTRLRSLADAEDYPSIEKIKSAFGVDVGYVALSAPESLAGVSREIWERETKRIQAQCQEAGQQVRDAMRSIFQDLLSHMTERLTPSADGKRKIFKNSLIGNFKEFIDSFADRNITDDKELEDLVNRTREILAGKTAEDLRANGSLRDVVAKQIGGIKAAIDLMVVDRPVRAVAIDEDEV